MTHQQAIEISQTVSTLYLKLRLAREAEEGVFGDEQTWILLDWMKAQAEALREAALELETNR